MKCEEVQKHLSDFLDSSFEVERAQEIEDHLAACSLCSEEVASLAACQRLVSGLPVVEPPVGFTTRVMARVREAAHPASLWERLFLPLRIKIPLQATAVVLIAILAAYIYQKEPLQRESEMNFPPESSFKKQEETGNLVRPDTPTPAAPSKTNQAAEETKARVQESKDSAQPKTPVKLSEQQKSIAADQHAASDAVSPQKQIAAPATLGGAPLQEKSSIESAAGFSRPESSSPERAKRESAPGPQPEKESVLKDTSIAAKPSLSPEARGWSATSSISALRSNEVVPADHELVIRLKESGRDDKVLAADRLASSSAKAERRSLTSQEEAKNLEQARGRAVQTGQPQIVWITIPLSQYDRLKKELADLGNLEAESSTPKGKQDTLGKTPDRLQIKVTLVPPLLSGNLPPAEPSSR